MADHAEETEGGFYPPLWVDLIITALATLVVVACVRSFVLDTFEVPTGSMLDTIQLGDRVAGEKISYRFHAPEASDVITFDDPESPSVTLIKRVIATEGQVVDLVDGAVYIDGVRVSEPYTDGKLSYPIDHHARNLSADVTYPHTVADGCVWVMGDNRTNSLDSRYFGDVSLSAISSRVMFIFWPFDHAGSL